MPHVLLRILPKSIMIAISQHSRITAEAPGPVVIANGLGEDAPCLFVAGPAVEHSPRDSRQLRSYLHLLSQPDLV